VWFSYLTAPRGALAAAGEIAGLPGIDYMSFGLNDLAQSLGHPGNANNPEVRQAVAEATDRIHAAGKPVREDFIMVGWVNDILVRGARELWKAT
jgi:4-hydroxy-2-oxoheptanedioate aldolase